MLVQNVFYIVLYHKLTHQKQNVHQDEDNLDNDATSVQFGVPHDEILFAVLVNWTNARPIPSNKLPFFSQDSTGQGQHRQLTLSTE